MKIEEAEAIPLLSVLITEAGYDSNTPMIKDISFDVKASELIGMIGPNGAGKSTTIKTILGLMDYRKGKVKFQDGARYSYLPERPVFYDELTLQEHIDFVAAVEDMELQEMQDRANYYLKKFHMEDFIHQLPSTYSKGMQQKAMLILAIMTKPHVYIIDEPFIGLDPDAMKELLTTIEEERSRGAGILMCTHVLDTAERVCDRFLIIAGGMLRAKGTLAEIRETCGLSEATLYECYHAVQGDKDE